MQTHRHSYAAKSIQRFTARKTTPATTRTIYSGSDGPEPAKHRAGLRKGDIVLQVCGIKVHDHAIAIQLIERRMVIGGAIELLVERKGSPAIYSVVGGIPETAPCFS